MPSLFSRLRGSRNSKSSSGRAEHLTAKDLDKLYELEDRISGRKPSAPSSGTATAVLPERSVFASSNPKNGSGWSCCCPLSGLGLTLQLSLAVTIVTFVVVTPLLWHQAPHQVGQFPVSLRKTTARSRGEDPEDSPSRFRGVPHHQLDNPQVQWMSEYNRLQELSLKSKPLVKPSLTLLFLVHCDDSLRFCQRKANHYSSDCSDGNNSRCSYNHSASETPLGAQMGVRPVDSNGKRLSSQEFVAWLNALHQAEHDRRPHVAEVPPSR